MKPLDEVINIVDAMIDFVSQVVLVGILVPVLKPAVSSLTGKVLTTFGIGHFDPRTKASLSSSADGLNAPHLLEECRKNDVVRVAREMAKARTGVYIPMTVRQLRDLVILLGLLIFLRAFASYTHAIDNLFLLVTIAFVIVLLVVVLILWWVLSISSSVNLCHLSAKVRTWRFKRSRRKRFGSEGSNERYAIALPALFRCVSSAQKIAFINADECDFRFGDMLPHSFRIPYREMGGVDGALWSDAFDSSLFSRDMTLFIHSYYGENGFKLMSVLRDMGYDAFDIGAVASMPVKYERAIHTIECLAGEGLVPFMLKPQRDARLAS